MGKVLPSLAGVTTWQACGTSPRKKFEYEVNSGYVKDR